MRVLFLAKYLDSGGITTHMHTLARKLRERGIDVAVASGGQVGNHTHGPEWFEAFDIPHFTVPFSGRERDLSKFLRSLVMFPRVVRNVAPDIIHVHWRAVSLFAQIEMAFHGIPFVTTLHLDGIPNKGLERWLSFWGAYTIAVSQETRKHMTEGFNVREDKIVLIPHGVDTQEFVLPTETEKASVRSYLGLSTASFVIAYIGRLVPEKRVRDLVNAAERLVGEYPDIHVLVAGTGPLEADIRGMIDNARLGNHVHMLGYTSTRNVLAASDVLCLPSSIEGFALVAIEAMMMGVPVIRTSVAGAKDQIVPGVNGWLYDVGHVDSLVLHMKNLIEDRSLRLRLAAEARRIAETRFSADVMAERTLEVYRKAIARCAKNSAR